ncbi:hypothetical protein ACS0TY_008957 [Phlomoides rotata]
MHPLHMIQKESSGKATPQKASVLSKVFYQQQQQQLTKPIDKTEEDNSESVHTPKSKSVHPERLFPCIEHLNMEEELQVPSNGQDQINVGDQVADDNNAADKWWEE